MNCLENRIENADKNKYVYVILTRTPTKFAGLIRKIMRKKYNHASISFSDDFKDVYTMGRYRHTTPIIAGPIKEHSERLSLRREKSIPCVIYKVPVSLEQYKNGMEAVNQIMQNREQYLYNLYSVLSYPLLRGFSTYKAFSCSEFVAYLLKEMNINLKRQRTSSYTPWHLHEDLKEFICYEGNILPLLSESNRDDVDYFSNVKVSALVKGNTVVLTKLIYRRCFVRK